MKIHLGHVAVWLELEVKSNLNIDFKIISISFKENRFHRIFNSLRLILAL